MEETNGNNYVATEPVNNATDQGQKGLSASEWEENGEIISGVAR